MYWSEFILIRVETGEKIIGITVGDAKDPVKPIFVIFSGIKAKGRKRKWEKPEKIKNWILYRNWQESVFVLTASSQLFCGYSLEIVSKENLLYPLDKEIIKEKYQASRQFLI